MDDRAPAAGEGEAARVPESLRARCAVSAVVGAGADGGSSLVGLAESGGMRVKTPRRRDGVVELALINTAGGIAGGDRHDIRIAAEPGARVVVSAPAAEKIYRSDGGVARLAVALSAGAGAMLDWLPQETILHDLARLDRTITVDAASDATVTLAEMLVFGREAHGEQPTRIGLADRWRLVRGGRLVLAEALRPPENFRAIRGRSALFADARCVATVLRCAPDAETWLGAVRTALKGARGHAGASAWNGLLVARFAAADAFALRHDVALAVAAVTGRPVPRLWGA